MGGTGRGCRAVPAGCAWPGGPASPVPACRVTDPRLPVLGAVLHPAEQNVPSLSAVFISDEAGRKPFKYANGGSYRSLTNEPIKPRVAARHVDVLGAPTVPPVGGSHTSVLSSASPCRAENYRTFSAH